MTQSMDVDDYMKHIGLKVEDKKPKYRNKPFRDEDGTYWHSAGEHKRWKILCLLRDAGEISDLKRQVKYELGLYPDTGRKCNMIWDFEYVYTNGGTKVVEDFKGFTTPEWRVKLAWFAQLNPEIKWHISGKKHPWRGQ